MQWDVYGCVCAPSAHSSQNERLFMTDVQPTLFNPFFHPLHRVLLRSGPKTEKCKVSGGLTLKVSVELGMPTSSKR